ncbi:hypothetical protein J6590_092489 [Homalodisca vitripennis]|nr:hypothetical protein J6590_092489 [Homalodisca vitripennis]
MLGFIRVPVSAVSGTGAASLPNETTETKTECPVPCQRSCTGIQPELACDDFFALLRVWEGRASETSCLFSLTRDKAKEAEQQARSKTNRGRGCRSAGPSRKGKELVKTRLEFEKNAKKGQAVKKTSAAFRVGRL